MKRATLLAVLGLISLVSAETLDIGYKNYLQSASPMKLMQSLVHPNLKNSEVTWGTCASDGGFKVDSKSTFNEP